MKDSIITTVCYLVTAADVWGFRGRLVDIVRVDRPTFPRSGKMDKRGIYEAWNAKEYPIAITGGRYTRYYWFRTIEDAQKAIERQYGNEIYHGAVFMDKDEYDKTQQAAKREYDTNC